MSSKCFYPKSAKTLDELANQFSQFIQQAWNPLVDGGITADNLSPFFFHPAVGAGGGGGGSSGAGSPGAGAPGAWLAPIAGSEGARRYFDVPLLHRTGAATIHQKKGKGIEFWVDTNDATYGRTCWVSHRDISKQIGSAIPEDPISNANPGIKFYANYGKGMFGTSGSFDWELHRAGVKSLSSDGTKLDTTDTQFRLGGTASTFPMFKRVGQAIHLRLADDSGYTSQNSSGLNTFGGGLVCDVVDNTTIISSTDTLGNGRIRFGTDASGNVMLRHATTKKIYFADSSGVEKFGIDGSGNMLFKNVQGTSGQLAQFDANGYPVASGSTTGSFQPLDSDLTAIAALVTTSGGRSLLTGSTLTDNTVPKGSSGALTDSTITDDATTITLGSPTAQIGKSTAGTIKTTDGNTARALTVRGSNATSGNSSGGSLTLTGGASTGTTVGATTTISGGPNTDNASSGNGGPLNLNGGNASAGTGNGGAVTIEGGATKTGTPGGVTIKGGQPQIAGLVPTVTIHGGDSTAAAVGGGNTMVRGGDGLTTGAGGTLTLRAGVSPSGTSGDFTIQSAAGVAKLVVQGSDNVVAPKGTWDLSLGPGVLKHNRGAIASVPALSSGELYVSTDTNEILVGV